MLPKSSAILRSECAGAHVSTIENFFEDLFTPVPRRSLIQFSRLGARDEQGALLDRLCDEWK